MNDLSFPILRTSGLMQKCKASHYSRYPGRRLVSLIRWKTPSGEKKFSCASPDYLMPLLTGKLILIDGSHIAHQKFPLEMEGI